MADREQLPRTGGIKARDDRQEPELLRSKIASAIASLDADLAEIEVAKEPSRDNIRPGLPLPAPEIIQAQRFKRLKELRSVFAMIKRRLDRR